MDIKDAATIGGFILTIGGAGMAYGGLRAQVEANAAAVAECQAVAEEARDGKAVLGAVQQLKCFVARIHAIELPECSR